MKQRDEKMVIVYVGSYPPRECGIATFTADLVEYFDSLFEPREETKIVAINTGLAQPEDLQYGEKVILQISENDPESYTAAAEKINAMPEVKLVSIQHEFGLFGPNEGEYIIEFLKAVEKPIALTFHTVLPHPSDHHRHITKTIIECVDRIIVMTAGAKSLLESEYEASADKIGIVPHGLHSRPYTNGIKAKSKLGLQGKKVLSTFGLLNVGKGIEFAIEALPRIIQIHPEIIYLVLGTTHPVVLKREGPVYINRLKERVKELGIEDHVIFHDEYMERDQLLDFLEATDIYLSLSQNPHQAVSGTLTYALGMGRPVISTPFAQAKEVLTPELGLLAEFNEGSAIANRVIELLNDPARLTSMSKTAYFRTRGMTWPNVALSYMREFQKISPQLAFKEKSLPLIKLNHLKHMTDDFGIFQFAILTEPDQASGYTIDDNARALITACWYLADFIDDKKEKEHLGTLAKTYFSFLERASGRDHHGGFENYFKHDREAMTERNEAENLADANARAAWSLAVFLKGMHLDVPGLSELKEGFEKRAEQLFMRQYAGAKDVFSPRAAAFHIKALAEWLSIPKDNDKNDQMLQLLNKYSVFLIDQFNGVSIPEWQWFEEGMTYSNAVLPDALLRAYQITKDPRYRDIAKRSLDFLVSHSFHEDMCVPVGQSGWFKQGEPKQLYDQQPEEVSALVLALDTAAEVLEDPEYARKKGEAFNWFLGNNTLGQVVYSEMTGGCYDGLGESYINLNQGAESTISYLLARICMEK